MHSVLVSMEVSAPVSCDSLYLPISPTLGAVVCSVTSNFLTALRGVVGFQFVQLFYLLLGWSDNLQTHYMPDQKPEVSQCSFILYLSNYD